MNVLAASAAEFRRDIDRRGWQQAQELRADLERRDREILSFSEAQAVRRAERPAEASSFDNESAP